MPIRSVLVSVVFVIFGKMSWWSFVLWSLPLYYLPLYYVVQACQKVVGPGFPAGPDEHVEEILRACCRIDLFVCNIVTSMICVPRVVSSGCWLVCWV